jgi:hypothetical protein
MDGLSFRDELTPVPVALAWKDPQAQLQLHVTDTCLQREEKSSTGSLLLGESDTGEMARDEPRALPRRVHRA